MLNLMLIVLKCELHMQNGLETPWEQRTEVDFHLAFGLCCNFSVKGIFRLVERYPACLRIVGIWLSVSLPEMKTPKICKLLFSP